MKIKKRLYELDAKFIKHYNIASYFDHSKSTIVDLQFQKYKIFKIPEKPYAAIAWPLANDKLIGLTEHGSILFESDKKLSKSIISKLNDDEIKIIVFPRYGE